VELKISIPKSLLWEIHMTGPQQEFNHQETLVDCQQLKRTGAKSTGCSAACNDFIPTACMRNMMNVGGTWHVKLNVDEE
jgi:hypothetical protein